MYDLAGPERLDGLVVMGALGNTVGAAGLQDFCASKAPLPIVTIAVPVPGFPSVLVDNASGMREAVSHLIGVHRRRRIAAGAGVQLNEVGAFMKQFEMTRDMMRAVGGMGVMGKLKLMQGLMSGKLSNLGMPGGPTLKTKKSGHMEKKDRNKKKRR